MKNFWTIALAMLGTISLTGCMKGCKEDKAGTETNKTNTALESVDEKKEKEKEKEKPEQESKEQTGTVENSSLKTVGWSDGKTSDGVDVSSTPANAVNVSLTEKGSPASDASFKDNGLGDTFSTKDSTTDANASGDNLLNNAVASSDQTTAPLTASNLPQIND